MGLPVRGVIFSLFPRVPYDSLSGEQLLGFNVRPMLEGGPFVQDFACDLGMVAAGDPVLGLDVAPRQAGDLPAHVMEGLAHGLLRNKKPRQGGEETGLGSCDGLLSRLRENVGPQLVAGHFPVGCRFDGGALVRRNALARAPVVHYLGVDLETIC